MLKIQIDLRIQEPILLDFPALLTIDPTGKTKGCANGFALLLKHDPQVEKKRVGVDIFLKNNIFFIFKKLFLILTYQNDLKIFF
jgi:hypothetical protein